MKRNSVGIILLSFSCLLHSVSAESEGGPKVGGKPPDISSLKLLEAPAEAQPNWERLKGKVVVLEFWATWCGPCVAAIPHMNELTEKFKDKPVQFIAITDEDEATTKRFLKKRPIKGWVALDREKRVNKAYGITAIPHTVIVDKNGDIADITYPLSVTEQRLNDILAAKKIAPVQRRKEDFYRAGELPQSAWEGKSPLYQVILRPSTLTNSSSTGGGGGLTCLGYTLTELLPQVYPFTGARIIIDSPLGEGRFDFVVKAPDRKDETRNALATQAIESTFGLTSRVEMREADAYVLTVQGTNASGLIPAVTKAFSASTGPGRISAINGSLGVLQRGLENQLRKPVIDETQLTGMFDIDLKWDQDGADANTETIIQAVREQLGLKLSLTKRRMEMLVVKKAASTEK
jgi:uncharacterized protein (TIGR03435 family)